jgi:hypothetical protein
MGDDHASPGMAVFHATFSVALHVMGRFVSAERLNPDGPRNCGQFPLSRTTLALNRPAATRAGRTSNGDAPASARQDL